MSYASTVDWLRDWALVLPPPAGRTWVVMLHGHGSHGDQLFTRPDIRDGWLPVFRELGLGVLSPNLRDNAWMSPPAVTDLAVLLDHVRDRFGARRFVFFSGSMGGTGNLIYAALRPGDVAAAVALGAVCDLADYLRWCRRSANPTAGKIAEAIAQAYGDDSAALQRHNALTHHVRLSMPVLVIHGRRDALMPVEQCRRLAQLMHGRDNFEYHEIADGDHDSPLHDARAIAWLRHLIHTKWSDTR